LPHRQFYGDSERPVIGLTETSRRKGK